MTGSSVGTKRSAALLLGMTVLLGLGTAPCAVAAIHFVDLDATAGAGTGDSWANAYTTLQTGIDAANADFLTNGGAPEVWVAEGTYTGATIELKDGAHVYGGFSGTEATRTERDWETCPTIIDGGSTRGCVTSSDIPADGATLDGFTLQNGRAGEGAGMHNELSSPTVANCAFVTNFGGGMYNSSSSPIVTNCSFSGPPPPIDIHNIYDSGMHNVAGSSPVVADCTFLDNSSINDGGAMSNTSSSPVVTNCTFSNNLSGFAGGAISNDGASSPVVTNCTFADNSSSGTAGAMSNGAGSLPVVTNCILWGNLPLAIAGPAAVTYSCVQGGFEGAGNISADPEFIGADFIDFRLHPSSPCIDTGTLAGAPTTDLNDVARPQGDGVDMGAHEYAQGTALATFTISLTGNPLLDSGAYWRINGGNWHPLGEIADLYAGTYVIAFSNAAHYTTPAEETLVLASGEDRELPPAYVSSPGAHLWHVDADNTSGVQDGTSWATAFASIQTGVNAAFADGGGEVWVAEGTYVGTTILLRTGTYAYGGFSGIETTRTERDWGAHPTIIDGEDTRGCVTSFDIPAHGGTFDGFTLQNGEANTGGGMYNRASSLTVANCAFVANWGGAMFNDASSSPRVTNCTFSNNFAMSGAGAMANDGTSSPVVTNCTFADNVSWDTSGAMFSDTGSSPVLVNCILWGNTQIAIGGTARVTYSCVEGGHAGEGNIATNPEFVNAANNDLRLQPTSPCIDVGTLDGAPTTDVDGVSRPQGAGADMGAHEFEPGTILATLTVPLFGDPLLDSRGRWRINDGNWHALGETVEVYAGTYLITFRNAAHYTTPEEETLVLTPGEDRELLPAYVFSQGAHLWHVDVSNTSGVQDGTSWATAFTSIRTGVTAAAWDGGGEIWVAEGTYVGTTIYLKFGTHVYGGFSGVETTRTERDWDAHPTIIDGENTRGCVDAFFIPVGLATLDGFTVQNGRGYSGAGMLNEHSSHAVTNCTFANNSADYGGAMFNIWSSPRVTNCTFSNNTSAFAGGAISNDGTSSPVVTNCTFADNSSSGTAGAILNDAGSSPVLVNCILWGNTPTSITEPGSGRVTYSCIEGGYEGEGNIATDPLFADADNNDLRLQPTSPCIDVGTLDGAPDADIDGVSRPQNLGVDMGAHEFLSTAPLGSVQVNILPQIAVDAGALWSPGGDHWLSSGDRCDLFEGMYTITFSEVPGRLTPQPVEVQVSGTQPVVIEETYGIDVNNDGAMNILDVQIVINDVLGLPVSGVCDINNDGETNAIDVQLIVNAALGIV